MERWRKDIEGRGMKESGGKSGGSLVWNSVQQRDCAVRWSLGDERWREYGRVEGSGGKSGGSLKWNSVH